MKMDFKFRKKEILDKFKERLNYDYGREDIRFVIREFIIAEIDSLEAEEFSNDFSFVIEDFGYKYHRVEYEISNGEIAKRSQGGKFSISFDFENELFLVKDKNSIWGEYEVTIDFNVSRGARLKYINNYDKDENITIPDIINYKKYQYLNDFAVPLGDCLSSIGHWKYLHNKPFESLIGFCFFKVKERVSELEKHKSSLLGCEKELRKEIDEVSYLVEKVRTKKKNLEDFYDKQ